MYLFYAFICLIDLLTSHCFQLFMCLFYFLHGYPLWFILLALVIHLLLLILVYLLIFSISICIYLFVCFILSVTLTYLFIFIYVILFIHTFVFIQFYLPTLYLFMFIHLFVALIKASTPECDRCKRVVLQRLVHTVYTKSYQQTWIRNRSNMNSAQRTTLPHMHTIVYSTLFG